MKWIRKQWNRLKRWMKKSKKPSVIKPKPREGKPVEQVGTVEGSVTKRTISMAGIALIIKFEGFSAVPYFDCAGVPTIGYGTIKYLNGRKVNMLDKPITKERAKIELMHEVGEKTKSLIKFIDHHNFNAKQHELDALISFAYNCGIYSSIGRRSTVARGIRNNDRDTIVRGMMMYTRAGGRKIKGLVRRRKAEVKMFREGK